MFNLNNLFQIGPFGEPVDQQPDQQDGQPPQGQRQQNCDPGKKQFCFRKIKFRLFLGGERSSE